MRGDAKATYRASMPSNERYYPATPEETYEALGESVVALFKLQDFDYFSRSVTFKTPMNFMSYGANMSASVIPHEDGSIVRVNGEAKVRTNFTAKGAEAKRINDLLDAVGKQIQANRVAK